MMGEFNRLTGSHEKNTGGLPAFQEMAQSHLAFSCPSKCTILDTTSHPPKAAFFRVKKSPFLFY
jgi:hypothetical protein